MCKLRRITHKLSSSFTQIVSDPPKPELSLWVIHRSSHIDKIHQNKIYSYYIFADCSILVLTSQMDVIMRPVKVQWSY